MPASRSRRPPTSQSSRPSTADDYAFSVPGTASSSSSPYFTSENPQPLPAPLHAQYAQYHYPDDPNGLGGVAEEDEDEESDAEDVFAYLPPTTADQQADATATTAHQAQLHFSPPHAHQQAESPPDTNSSYDHLAQGPDALRMRPMVTQSLSQSDPSHPYALPHSPLRLKSSPHGIKQHHVSLPSPTTLPSTPGPSQPPQSFFLPGSAFDNPYQFTLSQMSNSVPPSTRGSTFTDSDGLRHRHNINVGVIKRTKKRRDTGKSTDDPDEIFKEPGVALEGGSIAKLVSNDIASFEYARRSRRLEDGALDELDASWSNREGSIK